MAPFYRQQYVRNVPRMPRSALMTAIAAFVMRQINDSESSSSSDEEWEAALLEKTKRKLPRRLHDHMDVIERYSDLEFKSYFRLSRATFQYLLNLILENITRKVGGCSTIPAQKQLLITLWKMTTTDSYKSICDRFNVGKVTAVRTVQRVSNALFELSPQFIQWPKGNDATTVMQQFQQSSGFPRVIGAIGSTHIEIPAPTENAADYINHKGHHSIQLQLVCDHKGMITHCLAGYPGSMLDQKVFQNSEIADFLGNEEKFPQDSHIVGDTVYNLHKNLLTPFKDNDQLTDKEKNYNYCHFRAKTTVERSIRLLKGRLRSLMHCLPMARVDLMVEYVVACCVIHNICMLQKDDARIVLPSQEQSMKAAEITCTASNNADTWKRNEIMELVNKEC